MGIHNLAVVYAVTQSVSVIIKFELLELFLLRESTTHGQP